jgi:ABC-type branched-subunit amino acid transport system substrate-binding protein
MQTSCTTDAPWRSVAHERTFDLATGHERNERWPDPPRRSARRSPPSRSGSLPAVHGLPSSAIEPITNQEPPMQRDRLESATASRRGALRVLAAATTLLASPWTARAQSAGGAEILIGQSCQLSGPLAALSNEIREGAALVLDQVNAKGGVHGRQVRILALDDGYDASKASNNVTRLVDQDNVLALFALAGTPTNMAALPIVRDRRVPLIAPFSGADALRTNERYVFNVRAGYADEIRKIVEHLSTIGITEVGVAYMNNAFGKGGLEAVKINAIKHNATVVAAQALELDGKTLADAAAAMAKNRPKAIILVTAGKLTSDFIAQYQKVGGGAQFYALSVVSSQQLLDALGERSAGVAIAQVMPYPWGGVSKLAREISELARRKGIANLTYNHMEGFIDAKVLVEALRLAGASPTRESLTRALEGLTDLDLGGYRVRFSDRDRNGSNFVELTIVGNSKRVLR